MIQGEPNRDCGYYVISSRILYHMANPHFSSLSTEIFKSKQFVCYILGRRNRQDTGSKCNVGRAKHEITASSATQIEIYGNHNYDRATTTTRPKRSSGLVTLQIFQGYE